MPEGEMAGAGRRGDDDREDDDPDAVVEQALARHRRLQGRRHRRPLQDPHHRHRVGRADQGAEDEAPQERHLQAEQLAQQEEAEADDRRREENADGAEDEDRPPPPPHVVPVDVQRSGEEEEGQHPVHQRFVEIDVVEEARDAGRDVARRQDPVDREDDQGRHRAHDGKPDGRGQPEEAVVHIAERGRHHDEDGGRVERAQRRRWHAKLRFLSERRLAADRLPIHLAASPGTSAIWSSIRFSSRMIWLAWIGGATASLTASDASSSTAAGRPQRSWVTGSVASKKPSRDEGVPRALSSPCVVRFDRRLR